MKRTNRWTALMAAFLSLVCFALTAGAAGEAAGSIYIHSDIADLTADDREMLLTVEGLPLAFCETGAPAVLIADAAGTQTMEKIVAGRTYTIYFTLTPVGGSVLPEKVDGSTFAISCGKGASLVSVGKVRFPQAQGQENAEGVQIVAQVRADGNLWERLVGKLIDLWLKVRAWSLY